jgi:formate-dependent nitrite reductase membrane component NrfD
MEEKNPNGILGFLSFLLPIAGIIVGIIFLIKPEAHNKQTGRICLIWSIISIIIGCIIFLYNIYR